MSRHRSLGKPRLTPSACFYTWSRPCSISDVCPSVRCLCLCFFLWSSHFGSPSDEETRSRSQTCVRTISSAETDGFGFCLASWRDAVRLYFPLRRLQWSKEEHMPVTGRQTQHCNYISTAVESWCWTEKEQICEIERNDERGVFKVHMIAETLTFRSVLVALSAPLSSSSLLRFVSTS